MLALWFQPLAPVRVPAAPTEGIRGNLRGLWSLRGAAFRHRPASCFCLWRKTQPGTHGLPRGAGQAVSASSARTSAGIAITVLFKTDVLARPGPRLGACASKLPCRNRPSDHQPESPALPGEADTWQETQVSRRQGEGTAHVSPESQGHAHCQTAGAEVALEAALTRGRAHRPRPLLCTGLPDDSGMFREVWKQTGPAEVYLRDSCSINTKRLRKGRGGADGRRGDLVTASGRHSDRGRGPREQAAGLGPRKPWQGAMELAELPEGVPELPELSEARGLRLTASWVGWRFQTQVPASPQEAAEASGGPGQPPHPALSLEPLWACTTPGQPVSKGRGL